MEGGAIDALLRRLGTRRSATEKESARPSDAAGSSPGRFETMLATGGSARDDRRPFRLVGSPLPPGWRAEDFAGIGSWDGFVPVAEGAKQMGLTVAEVERLASAGWLEARRRGREFLVRPAVVSILRVTDRRNP